MRWGHGSLPFVIVRYPQRSLEAGGVVFAAVAVWSPFSAVGLLPLLAWATYRAGPRHLFAWMNLLAAPVLLIAATVFLTQASGGIPASVAWHHPGFSGRLWLGFVVLEFGAIAASLLLVAPSNIALIFGCVLALLLLSISRIGIYSDLMMRGSRRPWPFRPRSRRRRSFPRRIRCVKYRWPYASC